MATIEKVKQMIADGVLKQEDAEKYIPELKESEDEKIRKEIIAFLKYYHTGQGNMVVYDNDWIAWLEKQGNLVKCYEDKLDKCACDYFNKGYKKALEQQGEQKSVELEEPNFFDDFRHSDCEQKEEWSEEDEKNVADYLYCLNVGFTQVAARQRAKDICNLLRPQNQWKPSEEQMEALENAIRYGEEENIGILSLLYNDLKKLREE